MPALRAAYDAQAGRSLSLPMSGAVVWVVVGLGGLVLPERTATLVLLFGTGAMFPVALALTRVFGERLLDNTSELARLMGFSVLMVNLLWALHLSVFVRAPEFVPLTLGIGLGLHWVVFSWVIGHPVGVIHAVVRTLGVSAAWWLLPEWRISAVAAAVVIAYGYAIAVLARRDVTASAADTS